MPGELTVYRPEKGEILATLNCASATVTGWVRPRRDRGDNLAGKLPYFGNEKSEQIRFVQSNLPGRPRASVP